ncbi:lectin-like protein [Acetobacterium carbinolicum]|uniref:lectin-like protein n=1 Tax=Acetobacterium carbinolicum TaxID=52690 RepID=UPI003BF4FF98
MDYVKKDLPEQHIGRNFVNIKPQLEVVVSDYGDTSKKERFKMRNLKVLCLVFLFSFLFPIAGFAQATELQLNVPSSQKVLEDITPNLEKSANNEMQLVKEDFAMDLVSEESITESEVDSIQSSMNTSDFENKLNQWKGKYPNGSTYNNEFPLAIQCMGYARYLSQHIFGSECGNSRFVGKGWSIHYDINQIQPGDYVRYRNDVHSIFVTAVSGDTVTFTDANADWKNTVRWGITTTKADLNATLTYILHYSANPISTALPFISCIDNPVNNDVVDGGAFIIKGWAVDNNNISKFTYRINNGSEKELNRSNTRNDIFESHPEYRATNNQPEFFQEIDADELSYGSNTITIYAYTTEGVKDVGSRNVTRNILPLCYGILQNNTIIDNNSPFLTGWVLHGSGIKKLVYSIDGGSEIESALIERPDVANHADLQGYPKVNSGINVKLDLGKLRAGTHTVDFRVTAGTGKVYSLEQRSFIVKESAEPVKTVKKNGKTYSIYNQLLNWDEAKAKAESLGGILMSITSAEENEIAKELIQTADRGVYWVGGTDGIKEGTWQWLTGESFNYSNWEAGEPNNAGVGENCLGIVNGSKMQWNDFPGDATEGGFIVENDSDKPVITDVKVTDVSSSGYTVTCTVSDNSGINRVQFPTWTLSNVQDDLDGSWETNPKYSGTIQGNTVSFRVKDSDHNYEEGLYRTHIYAYDIFGNISAVKVEDFCGDTNVTNDNTPVATVNENGTGYLLYDEVLSYQNAKSKCGKMGGHLLTINSSDEQKLIQELIKKGVREGYFIGTTDEIKEGQFSWITGEPFTYTNWGRGEPNNWTGLTQDGEDFGMISKNDGKWNDVHATHTIGYICEKNSTQTINIENFTADKISGQNINTNINLAAQVSGGTTPYRYKFYTKKDNVTSVIQDFSPSNVATFKPNTAGTYTIYVEIKDAAGKMTTRSIENYLINDNTEQPVSNVSCVYRTHVQNEGWQALKYNGDMSGTSGKSYRLEGIEINLENQGYDLGVVYSTHVENIGWQDIRSNGAMSGTSGKALRLEAIKINLTGADADKFNIYYQVHAQNFGWLDWAKNGESSGTEGFGYRLEGIRIKIVPKDDQAPGSTTKPFVQK